MYKSFSDVLAEPLRETEGSLHPSREADEMAIENEDTSTMELDNEGGIPQKRCLLLNSLRSQCILLFLLLLLLIGFDCIGSVAVIRMGAEL